MLDQKTKDTIKATAPILAEHGLALTMRMYEIMFSRYPEVKAMFNSANQHPAGQPLTLARAVHAYAEHIEDPSVLADALELMAHKHVSLGVKAEHYGIVGECLLEALDELLSPGEEIMSAWEKGYGFLADVLIDMEAKLYEEVESKEGGWKDLKSFVVEKKEKESDVITSFYLKPKDGAKLPDYEPGQYITVQLEFTDDKGEKQIEMRNYSLSDEPNGNYFRISVKREAAPADTHFDKGVVSNYLHDHIGEGDEVSLRGPIGNFHYEPQNERPVVLLSGGVGLTPMVSILNTIADKYPQTETYFIHGALNSEVHAMREHVKEIADSNDKIRAFTCYSAPLDDDLDKCDKTGFITAEWLEDVLPSKDCEYYFCGPKAFMQLIYQVLRGWDVPESQIHYEFFGPAGELTEAA